MFHCLLLLAAVPVEAGFAQVDITPAVGPKAKPVWMAGFGTGRKAEGVADRLHARAAVFRHGKDKVALVSLDLVGLFLAPALRVRAELPGFAHVVVCCTHNHEGPDSMGLWGPRPFVSGIDADYLALVEKKAVEAVKAAEKAARPVSARIGSVKAAGLLHDSRKPIVLHDDLVVLVLESKGKPAGLVVQWNCHPETLDSKNKKLSADFVGYAVAALRKRYRCPVVYLTGTVGGLMTSLHADIRSEKGEKLADGTFEKTARYGELLALAAAKAEKAAKPATLSPIVARRRSVHLPLDNAVYVVAKQFGVLDREAFLWKDGKAGADPVAEVDPRRRHAIRTEVAHVRLGDLGIACIPGEIYPELVLGKVADPAEKGADFPDAAIEPGIYAQMRAKHKMLVGLANDEIGYILPKRQWDEKPPYCYGAKKRPYGEANSLGPDTAPLLCEAFARMMKPR